MATLRAKLCKLKDPVPAHEKPGVVYRIPCRDCDQAYVGETGKQLKTRLHEHQLALRRADPRSHLWQHCSHTGHEIAINDAQVIGQSNKKQERLVLEAILSDNAYNRHIDLDAHYQPIIAQVRRATHTQSPTQTHTPGQTIERAHNALS
jgi:hypothetical protein